MSLFCLQLNIAARSLTEGVENGPDQPSAVAKPARKSLTGETSKAEPKRHTMHFVGQRDGESQSACLQRRSLDISSSERLADDNTRQVHVGVQVEMGKWESLRMAFSLASAIFIKLWFLSQWKEAGWKVEGEGWVGGWMLMGRN